MPILCATGRCDRCVTSDERGSMPAPIICGVDDSRGAREAVIAAAAVSERIRAPLVCVHVAAGASASRHDGGVSEERMRTAATLAGDEVLAQVAASGGRDGGATRRVEIGRPAERLVSLAVSEGADMIVVGSRGRGPLAAALLGSTSREVISQAPCPVLVIPPGAAAPARHRRLANGQMPSVLCGVDGSVESSYAAKAASQLAWRMNNRLVLGHSYPPMTTYGDRAFRRAYAAGPLLAQWRAGLKHLDAAAAALEGLPEPEVSLEPGDPATELVRIAKRERAELVVVGSHGQGKLQAALYGSVAATLAASAPIPVLVVPPSTGLLGGNRVDDSAAIAG